MNWQTFYIGLFGATKVAKESKTDTLLSISERDLSVFPTLETNILNLIKVKLDIIVIELFS